MNDPAASLRDSSCVDISPIMQESLMVKGVCMLRNIQPSKQQHRDNHLEDKVRALNLTSYGVEGVC